MLHAVEQALLTSKHFLTLKVHYQVSRRSLHDIMCTSPRNKVLRVMRDLVHQQHCSHNLEGLRPNVYFAEYYPQDAYLNQAQSRGKNSIGSNSHALSALALGFRIKHLGG